VKLSEGDRGELLIKSPIMFSQYAFRPLQKPQSISLTISSYLSDPVTTEQAFEDEGYFKTGDYVRRVGGQYVIDGRINSDCEHLTGPCVD
jgi:malonyl-CoA/methylmalonyl-CoA synthetase